MTKAGYWTRPAAEQLAALSDAQLAALSGFAVGRTGYGVIEWEGETRTHMPTVRLRQRLVGPGLTHAPDAVDVRGLDLDAVVVIRHAGVRGARKTRSPANLPRARLVTRTPNRWTCIRAAAACRRPWAAA